MAAEPKFVVDANVGRLAKWLRMMGYDTLFPEHRNDNDLVRIALRENRVLVTRDSAIAARRAVRLGQLKVVLIESDQLRKQMRQLVNQLGLTTENGFSRCVVCNQVLEAVSKDQVMELLPKYVQQTQERFHQCPQCRRIYWRGTHWSNMVAELDHICQEKE